MEHVVATVAPTLETAGFHKRRHAFNRVAEPGLVHVVSFQMGAHEPPGSHEIPSYRRNRYGTFTVNLGVFVPEMVIGERSAPGGWVNEHDCQLRKRLGELLASATERWWSLDDPVAAAATMAPALAADGLRWLDRFSTRSDLVREYLAEGGIALGMTARGPVEIAWLLAESDRHRAESLLRDYLLGDLQLSHRRWLEELLRANGFASLLTG